MIWLVYAVLSAWALLWDSDIQLYLICCATFYLAPCPWMPSSIQFNIIRCFPFRIFANVTCWWSSQSIKTQEVFYTFKFYECMEIFETVDCEHKNSFAVFIWDFLCFSNLTSTSLVLKSNSLAGAISSTGLKWAKGEKKKLNVFIATLRGIVQDHCVTQYWSPGMGICINKRMIPNFSCELSWLQIFFLHKF